ncbi:cleavage/polyadenylation specificity factor, 25kDa subunit [Tanacetum coccineum]
MPLTNPILGRCGIITIPHPLKNQRPRWSRLCWSWLAPLFGSKPPLHRPPLQACWSRLAPFFFWFKPPFHRPSLRVLEPQKVGLDLIPIDMNLSHTRLLVLTAASGKWRIASLFRALSKIEDISDGNMRSCLFGSGGVGETRESRRGSRVEAKRRIRVGSWNVGSLTRKILELVNVLERHKVDIVCFQETKWKGSRTKEGNGYKFWYSDSQIARNRVGVILKACLKDKLVYVNRCSDKIISLTLVIEGEFVNVINSRVRSPVPKILWKNLNGDAVEAFRARVAKGVSTQIKAISDSDADSIWNILASIIKDATKDSLDVC